MSKPVCYLDTEVCSRVPIRYGVHAFLDCPDARLLLVSWQDPVDPGTKVVAGRALDPLGDDTGVQSHVWAPHLGPPPAQLIEILQDPAITKKAHNAQFDFLAFQKLLPRHGFHLGGRLTLDDWECTMVQALGCSLPASLSDLGAVLGLPEDQRKLADGKKLIRLFCIPQYDKKTDSYYWADHTSHPDEWARFEQYALQDTLTLAQIGYRLRRYAPSEREWELWRMDQRINMNGLPIDDRLVQGALSVAEREKKRNLTRMRQLTGIDNPNSVAQLLQWVEDQVVLMPDMTKLSVTEALEREDTPDDVKEVLRCRQEVSKTSTAKYQALVGSVSDDGRLRGAFQFRGASRTGRYTGRIFQPHNLPRGHLKVDLERGIDQLTPAVETIREGDPHDELSWTSGRPMDVLSSCIRSVVRAPRGYELHVSDLNAIENRVLGYLARCSPTLQIFRDGLDPYKVFGAKLFRKPYNQITGEERTWSKPAVLGGGYQLGGGDERLNKKTGRMEKTGLWGYAAAMKIHLTKDQAHEAVRVFRETFPNIVQLWYDLDDAFRAVIKSNVVRTVGYLTLRWEKPFVTIELPSGRKLYYCSPEIQPRVPPWELEKENPKRRPTITFRQMDQKTNKWLRTTTHGGKLTENVCQAVANDVLNEGLWRAEQGIGIPEPYEIIGHVHDEGIALVPLDSPLTIEHLNRCLADPVVWAPNLPLAAHGFTTQIYRKD